MNFDHSEYIKAVLGSVDSELIKKQNYRILLDPANGCAAEVGRKIFSQLGELIMINDRVGEKPERPSEPRRENLSLTIKRVVESQCDLGLATDVDADRVLFIDETGEVLSEDLAGAILCEGKIAVTPLNSSGLFKKAVEENGGKLVESLVGPPEIIKTMKQAKADFGYEESGKYFFGREKCFADGILAGVKMLGVMARERKKLSEIRKNYPVYFQVKLALKCAWDKMPKKYVGKGNKKIFGDSFRFIRASGTEPLIRVFSDSPSKKIAEELADEGKKIVEKELCGE